MLLSDKRCFLCNVAAACPSPATTTTTIDPPSPPYRTSLRIPDCTSAFKQWGPFAVPERNPVLLQFHQPYPFDPRHLGA